MLKKRILDPKKQSKRSVSCGELLHDHHELLAPYPKAHKNQDLLVHRVEVFANFLKDISSIINFVAEINPLYIILAKIEKALEKRNWRKRAQKVPLHELEAPSAKALYVAQHTHAMDQNFFYILKQGRIWYKPIAVTNKAAFRLLGPDGLPPSGVKLTAISADGGNLIALDEKRRVNYVHMDKINFVVTDKQWQIKKIALDWTDRWFAIPLVKNIINLFVSPHLKLPRDCKQFAVSRKGPETGYYTDMNGRKQPEFLVGVTTLYALSDSGRIFFADPWLGNKFHNEITGPKNGQFVAETFAAAASTLFLMRRDKKGHPIMYTRFADYDSIGSNPILPATYATDKQWSLQRALPAEPWLQQPCIALHKKAKITGKIAILQLGRGQNNRELRVEGCDTVGNAGYYYKYIYEKNWRFASTPEKVLQFRERPQFNCSLAKPVTLDGKMFTHKNLAVKGLYLKNFLYHGLNERGLNTTLEITLSNNTQLSLPLHARRGLVHFLGLRNERPYWELVKPTIYTEDYSPETRLFLKALFKKASHVAVMLAEKKNGEIIVSIKNKKINFKFSEKRLAENSAPRNSFCKKNHHISESLPTLSKQHCTYFANKAMPQKELASEQRHSEVEVLQQNAANNNFSSNPKHY